jgi:hypothetical protein
MLAQDTQTMNLRYHRLEVRNHWLIAITLVVVAVLLAAAALFAVQTVSRTADETTAQQFLTAIESGSTDGLDSVFAPSAIYVDHTGMVSTGLTEIKASVAMDQAFAPDILSIGSPTTTGAIVSVPFTWDNSLGLTGHGIQVSQFDDGKVIYSAMVLAND